MRIARILDDRSPLPALALERDGALYDVGELDRRRSARDSTQSSGRARSSLTLPSSDFFTRVIALGGPGLAELDERLRFGDRPTEARLSAGSFVWLPPCDVDRALHVVVTADASGHPRCAVGDARGLVGHGERIPIPVAGGLPAPDDAHVQLAIGTLLRDDLSRATADEAAGAMLGHAIVGLWGELSAQLGPVLVTREELAELEVLRAQIRIDGKVVEDGRVGPLPFAVEEAIAFASQRVPLRAGDLITVACAGAAGSQAAPIALGARVDLLIEDLGKLSATPVRGAAPIAWRRGPRREG